MNKVNNLYRVIIIFLICIGGTLLVKNYKVVSLIKYQDNKLQLLEKKEVKKNYKISCAEILSELNNIENLNILNFTNSNSESLSLQAEIIGDKNKVKNILTQIKNSDNFYNISSIRIQQEELDNMKVVADIKFRRNE
ncbi:hypothetical protein [Clostridium kluyveri]|uniref:Uncharacterized protein n=2 Tax=Clostridium kluyveri TaxID=1534 RepID=A5N7H5_CLOK5|nr:hypothetical protein [Clostridium kluyveri]EDK33256.1 Hypothetical protein CKL_1214 [Clostridium kluyveri DSM 555]BAH06162.1 hypothetical protein CKR_1111 [Clostridium kluyveri NBRC 12016]